MPEMNVVTPDAVVSADRLMLGTDHARQASDSSPAGMSGGTVYCVMPLCAVEE